MEQQQDRLWTSLFLLLPVERHPGGVEFDVSGSIFNDAQGKHY